LRCTATLAYHQRVPGSELPVIRLHIDGEHLASCGEDAALPVLFPDLDSTHVQ